jgi:hypothetical protein
VGTQLNDDGMTVSYGPACTLDDLRDRMAELSDISKDQYL